MNYSIVQNEYELRNFIGNVLPELLPEEVFYVSLLARNKYLHDKSILAKPEVSLKRFTSKKDYLFQKIYQLETEIDNYTFEGKPIPQQALALYITPNPRNLVKATESSCHEFVRRIARPYDGYNPHSLVLGEIQKASGQKVYMDFDFDLDIDTLKPQIKQILTKECFTFVKTRGGFHLLVNIEKASKCDKMWYNRIKNLGADVVGTDTLVPVPGCIQGDFSPYIVASKEDVDWSTPNSIKQYYGQF